MHQDLKRVRKIIRAHKYRSQLNARIISIFAEGSHEHQELMGALADVAATHDKGRRDDGQFLKSHEYAMLAIALVYCRIRDLATLLAIVYHDMYEDYPDIWPLSKIERKRGAEVAQLVDSVSKPPKEDYATEEDHDEAVFAKVRTGGIKAMQIKCIDRLHNLLTLVGEVKKKTRKILQTVQHVMPIACEISFLIPELVAALGEQSVYLTSKVPAH